MQYEQTFNAIDNILRNERELEENQKKIISECDALKQALLRKVFE